MLIVVLPAQSYLCIYRDRPIMHLLQCPTIMFLADHAVPMRSKIQFFTDNFYTRSSRVQISSY